MGKVIYDKTMTWEDATLDLIDALNEAEKHEVFPFARAIKGVVGAGKKTSIKRGDRYIDAVAGIDMDYDTFVEPVERINNVSGDLESLCCPPFTGPSSLLFVTPRDHPNVPNDGEEFTWMSAPETKKVKKIVEKKNILSRQVNEFKKQRDNAREEASDLREELRKERSRARRLKNKIDERDENLEEKKKELEVYKRILPDWKVDEIKSKKKKQILIERAEDRAEVESMSEYDQAKWHQKQLKKLYREMGDGSKEEVIDKLEEIESALSENKPEREESSSTEERSTSIEEAEV